MTLQQSNQGKLSVAQKSKTTVIITTKEGQVIKGVFIYAESGPPDWMIKESNGSSKKVNLHDVESVS